MKKKLLLFFAVALAGTCLLTAISYLPLFLHFGDLFFTIGLYLFCAMLAALVACFPAAGFTAVLCCRLLLITLHGEWPFLFPWQPTDPHICILSFYVDFVSPLLHVLCALVLGLLFNKLGITEAVRTGRFTFRQAGRFVGVYMVVHALLWGVLRFLLTSNYRFVPWLYADLTVAGAVVSPLLSLPLIFFASRFSKHLKKQKTE